MISIPLLIRYLDTERFGVLGIAWAVLGYFSLFDFGVGRATTKYVSESIKNNEPTYARDLIWNSFLVHFILGSIGGAILAVVSNWIVYHQFKIPAELLSETVGAFYFLAGSIPALVAASCFRGVLEAIHRFDLINFVRIPSSTLNFLIPLTIIAFSKNLIAIVAAISICRYIVLFAFMFLCIRQLSLIKSNFKIKTDIIRKLFGFGLWVLISCLITPMILFADRFTIASIFSIEAVAYYVVPYEITTKLWIFSASILGVMFPVFSSMADYSEIKKLSEKAFIFLMIVVVPISGLLIGFGRELLGFWINEDFAEQSGTVMKWLTLGVLVNVLAQIPYTALQAAGKPYSVAKIQLLELPFYIALMIYLANILGTVGIALAWFIRAILDAFLLQACAVRLINFNWFHQSKKATLWKSFVILVFLFFIWAIEKNWRYDLLIKFLLLSIIFTLLLLWELKVLFPLLNWRRYLDPKFENLNKPLNG